MLSLKSSFYKSVTKMTNLCCIQVCLNKERISKLENAVLASRNAEDRYLLLQTIL